MGNAIANASHQTFDFGNGFYGGLSPSFTQPAANLFVDDFSTGDLSAIVAVNTINFNWQSQNRTSLVKDDTTSLPAGTDGLVVWTTSNAPGDGTPVLGRNWVGLDTVNSMRFRYPANEPWAEQRFDYDAQTDLWVRWKIRVPTNYIHQDGPIGDNNKFISIWSDGYSSNGTGSTFWLSMVRPSGTTDTNLEMIFSAGNNTVGGGPAGNTPFIDSSADKGRWMHMVIHLKMETSDGADDGVMQVWRRWEGAASYTKLMENLATGLRIPDASPLGFANGYMLGYHNSEYAADTEWLVGDIEMSSAALVPVGDL